MTKQTHPTSNVKWALPSSAVFSEGTSYFMSCNRGSLLKKSWRFVFPLEAWKAPLLCIYLFSYAVYEHPPPPPRTRGRDSGAALTVVGLGAGRVQLQEGLQSPPTLPLPHTPPILSVLVWCLGALMLSWREHLSHFTAKEDFHKNIVSSSYCQFTHSILFLASNYKFPTFEMDGRFRFS